MTILDTLSDPETSPKWFNFLIKPTFAPILVEISTIILAKTQAYHFYDILHFSSFFSRVQRRLKKRSQLNNSFRFEKKGGVGALSQKYNFELVC